MIPRAIFGERATRERMRPIHLLAVFALALAALFVAWFATQRSAGFVQAANAAATDSTRGGEGSSLVGGSAVPDETPTREPIRFGPSAEEIERIAAEQRAQAERRVVGRVVDKSGTGVAGATVWATTAEGWIQYPLDIEPGALPSQWLKVETVATELDGTFALKDLKPGPLRIAVRAGGFAPTYLDHLNLPKYEKHSVGEIVLERGVRVEGRVLGPDGKPYAGAKVLIALDCVHRASLVTLPGRGVPAGVSDGEGAFVVDQLAAGPWHLLIEAPECVLAECDGRIEYAGGKETGVIVRLEAGCEISGKVVSKETAMPTGLRISARQKIEENTDDADERRPVLDAASAESEKSSRNAVRTRYGFVDAEGAFTIRGLKAGADYRLTASRQITESEYKPFTAVEPQTVRAPRKGVELNLKPESALVFRVVDDVTGEALTDFTVFAGVGRTQVLRDDKNEVLHVFEDGRVRFGELRIAPTNTRSTVLIVRASGYKDHENKNIALRTGVELDLGEIRMKREVVVVATVLDAETGAPVEGARVVLSDSRDEDSLRETQGADIEDDLLSNRSLNVGRTGADGRARVTATPSRSVLVVAAAKGYRTSRAARVMMPPDADQTVEFKLDHGGVVIAKVTDGNGHPVAGVGVQHRLPRTNLDDENIQESVKSDADGIVRFEALDSGVHGFRVREDDADAYFWNESGAEIEPDPWREVGVVDGKTVEIEFVAPPRGGVFGTVTEGGRPVEGAHIKFVPRNQLDDSHGEVYWGGAVDPFATVSGHDGSYKIEHLRCGEYSALVVLGHRTMATEFRVRIHVEPLRYDFALEISGIEGRVTDSEGRPLANLQVNCWRAQGGLQIDAPYQMEVTEDDRGNPNIDWKQISGREIRTDANGQYLIPGLVTQEPLVVSVGSAWFESAQSPHITLSAGEVRHGVDFVLRAAGQVRVTMTGGRSRGDGWYQCTIQGIGEGQEQRAYGTYVGSWNNTGSINSVLPGRYKLTVRRNGNEAETAVHESELEVKAGEVTRVSFDPKR
ncbi:MAG: carboxypeptidase regulatory-like domain-containing protein [Planctomycetes bacterium]|nr:carboxypeptidase regulatory-like domain-containing protein [Planctomycetota bacterium]